MNTPSDAEVSEHLRTILSAPEFQEPLASRAMVQLERLFGELLTWVGALSPLALAIIVVGCLAVLGAIALQIVYAFRKAPARPWRTAHPSEGIDGQAELSAAGVARRARMLAAQGQLRDAARALQQALLLSLCQRKGIPWQPTLADWEWMNLLGASPALIDFTLRTQRLAFGSEPTRGAFEECVGIYQRLESGPG